MTAHEKRAALLNRPTRYELVAERNGERILIAYTMRRSRHTILTALQKHSGRIIERCDAYGKTLTWLTPANRGCDLGGWRIYFTGRTQREAIGSELPWIGDTKPAAA